MSMMEEARNEIEEFDDAIDDTGEGDLKESDVYDDGILRYDEYLYPTIPEPLEALRGLTSRDEELEKLGATPRNDLLCRRQSRVLVDDDTTVVERDTNIESMEKPKASFCTGFCQPCSRGWNKFSQQQQNGWVPVYTPKFAIVFMLALTLVFIPIGIASLVESLNTAEMKIRYDNICQLQTDDTMPPCSITVTIDNDQLIKNINKNGKKLYLYYEMKNQFQNIRRYVNSVSWTQLMDKSNIKSSSLNRCKPEKYVTREQDSSLPNDGIVNPCGLSPWTFQNDTISLEVVGMPVPIDENNIAWQQDVDSLYGSQDTVNFNTIPSYRGGGKIDGPLNENQHFIVWMRLGTRSTFRKLYGEVETQDSNGNLFEMGTDLTFVINNFYNSYNFNGEKYVVISTLSFLGSENNFTGIMFLVIGSLCMLTAVVVVIITTTLSMPVGDLGNVSWLRIEDFEDEEET